MMKKGVQGGSVEASVGQQAVEEQDMDLDLSLTEKTRESQIDLGSVGQGPRSRSSSANRMINLLKGSARNRNLKKVGLHKVTLRKAMDGKCLLYQSMNAGVETKTVQKGGKQLKSKRVLKEKLNIQQHRGLDKKRVCQSLMYLQQTTA